MTQVTTQVFETYQSLNSVYFALKQFDEPTVKEVESLNGALIILRDLNDGIAKLESGPFDVINRKDLALQQRAAAWLLGWAAFSRMIISSSHKSSDRDFRKPLILLNEPSALGLLLAIYSQLKDADSSTPEPLQQRLTDRTNIIAFSYKERINKEDGSSDWYIPSSAEILGKSDDDPHGRRDILSLWGLANLQLDTWYSSAPEYRPHGCAMKDEIKGDGSLGLSALADWLEAVNTDTHLAPLGRTDGFKTPIGKIVKFLRFRQRYASGQELATLCEDVRVERLRSDPKILESLKPLVEAATPAENGEQLYDASIWLRYIVLLSFDRERSVITDGAATNNLEKLWTRLRPGEPYVPVVGTEEGRKSSSCAPFLRWNAAPYSGNVSAVLADLIGATYRYLGIERHILDLEKGRFETVSKVDLKTSGQGYAKKLNEPLAQLGGVFKESIQPYFPSVLHAEIVAGYRPADWAEPSTITRLGSPPAIAFLTSCTPSEQERLAGDLSTVAKEIKSTEAKYSLLQRAYERLTGAAVDLKEVTAILEPLGGLTALSNWNLYSLPSKQFDAYVTEFTDAIKRLTDGADANLTQQQLARTFRIKREQLEAYYLILLAARLGREVSQGAIQIAQIYQRVNELGVQIEELEYKITNRTADAWKNRHARAAVKLAYATRMRDLVAARIEALIEAGKETEKLIAIAETELAAMAEQLRQAARTIKDNESNSAVFGIVKFVVNLVGAVLAPITAGASVAAAMLVSKGIDIYMAASKMDWGSLDKAITNLIELGPAVVDAINFGVENFGSTKLKDDWARASAFVKSTREKFQATFGDFKEKVEQLGTDLKNDPWVSSVIDAVKNLKDADNVLNFAVALGNGYTVTVVGTTYRFDFQGQQVTIKNERLRQGLRDLYAAGYIIINDAGARAEGLTRLVELSDEELHQKLFDSFRGAVGQLPQDFLGKLDLKVDESKKRAEQALERLKESVAKEMNRDELRLFAKLLAAGYLFVKGVGGEVVAIDPPPFTEADKLKQRIQKYKDRVGSETVNEIITRWNGRKKELMDKAQELSANQDAERLANFARSLAAEIESIKKELVEINEKVAEARDELEDKDTEVVIADYEAKADALFAEAEQLRVQQADLRGDQAKLKLEMAHQLYLNTLTEDERTRALVSAEMRRVESGELALIQTYEKCLAMGFNPLSPPADFDVYGAVSVRKALARHTDLGPQLSINNDVPNAADSLMGMIQWANLLGVRPADVTKSPTNLYLDLVETLTGNEQPGHGETPVTRKLVSIQKGVQEGIGDLTLGNEVAEVIVKGPLSFAQITWLDRPELDGEEREKRDELIQARREALLAGMVNDEYKDRVIGLVRVVVDAVDARNEDTGDIKFTRPVSVKRQMYYADIDLVKPIASKGDLLSFLVVPPRNPRSHPESLSVGAAALEHPRDIPDDKISGVMEQQYREQLKSLIKKIRLTGALGLWTVLILTLDALPEQRLTVARKLMEDEFQIDGLQMMFIQVPKPK